MKDSIPFNRPARTHREEANVREVFARNTFSAGNAFAARCERMLQDRLGCEWVLLATSGTHALEMAAVLAGIMPGDEVILPSFTFASTANAFVLRGAVLVFVDIRPDTMNIDEERIAEAITENTRAVVPVHYGGVGAEMNAILEIAHGKDLIVIEDAAQGFMARYDETPLGTLGQMGIFSFHEAKNIHCGEGGALSLNAPEAGQKAEVFRDKGTNRAQFLRGEVERYTWIDVGTAYAPSELQAAFLCAQLEEAHAITADRLRSWRLYREGLSYLAGEEIIEIQSVPPHCTHNGHILYIKARDGEERGALTQYLAECRIQAQFHFTPLHSAPAGLKFGRFCGEDRHTTRESERLLRLPLYHGMTEGEVLRVVEAVHGFYSC